MMAGWKKEDPHVKKNLLVESKFPEFLARLCARPVATHLEAAVGGLALVSFYYLMRVDKYTVKGKWDESKQTVNFCLIDVVLFICDK